MSLILIVHLAIIFNKNQNKKQKQKQKTLVFLKHRRRDAGCRCAHYLLVVDGAVVAERVRTFVNEIWLVSFLASFPNQRLLLHISLMLHYVHELLGCSGHDEGHSVKREKPTKSIFINLSCCFVLFSGCGVFLSYPSSSPSL